MFSSSETAAAAAAVLAVGSDCGKEKRRNSCKKRKKNLAADLFIDSPELLHEQKPAEAIQSLKKIFEYAGQTNYHGYTCVGMWGNLTLVHIRKHRSPEFLCHILGTCSHKETRHTFSGAGFQSKCAFGKIKRFKRLESKICPINHNEAKE